MEDKSNPLLLPLLVLGANIRTGNRSKHRKQLAFPPTLTAAGAVIDGQEYVDLGNARLFPSLTLIDRDF